MNPQSRLLDRFHGAALLIFLFLAASTVSPAQQNGGPGNNQLPARLPAQTAAWQTPSGHEQGGDLQSRYDWFYQQRAYPLQQIPPGVRLKAWRDFKSMQAAEQEAAPLGPLFGGGPGPLTLGPWQSVGPQPINPAQNPPFNGFPTDSGRVRAMAVDPTNSQVVYLGSAGGGVWKTTNGGTSWTPLTDTQASLAIGAIAIDPTNHETIYVGTGEEVPVLAEGEQGSNYYGAGILKSTNGGSTWTLLGFTGKPPFGPDECEGGVYIGALSVSPANNQDLLAAVTVPGASGCENSSASGIYRSTNGGVTWTAVLTGAAGTAVTFLPNPYGAEAWAALGDYGGNQYNGLYYSLNSGQTWTLDNVYPLPYGYLAGWIALALPASDTAGLYVSVADPTTQSNSLEGIYATSNGGGSWYLTNAPDYCNPQCWYDNVLAVDPNNASAVYAGGAYQYNNPMGQQALTVVMSPDGGTTWYAIEQGTNGQSVHTDTHALAFASNSSVLYAGSDGGAWSTTNVGQTSVAWTGLNNTLSTVTFYPGVSVSPTSLNVGFAGAQDNGTQQYTGSLTWNNVTCGDGGYTAIDFTTPTTAYSACAAEGGLVKSTSGGAVNTWNQVTTGINAGDRKLFVAPLAMDPSNSKNLYYGTYVVYQTTNGAGSWQPISPDLTTGAGYVSAVAVAPSNSNTVYAGTSDSQVQVTTNALAGASAAWQNISTGLPPRWITWLAVDRSSATTVYVTFSGFSGFSDHQGHVFKSTNQGASWTDISGNLPNVPVNCIAIDPGLANTYYVATDVGIFSTSNGGTTWSTLSTGLPNSPVTGLTIQKAARTLRAVTFGRGAWDLALPAASEFVAMALSSDYSGTGEADFAVWRPSNGTFYVQPANGSSTSQVWGEPGDINLSGDYDGDGKTDYAIWRPSTGTFYVILSSTGKTVSQAWGLIGDVPVPGDYDGDGKTDYAVWRPSKGTFYVILSSTGKSVSQAWGETGDLPVPGDYDGDGKTDYAVFRPSNGTWYAIASGTGKTLTQQWGEVNDFPVPGDYDGDGKTDYAVWRASIGTWYVLLSSTGKTATESWGQLGDIPSVGDYDGDSKTDYAVWRPSNGTWYVVYSSTGKTASRQWGSTGDVPASPLPLRIRRDRHIANFDGDRKADISIWRPSNGTWYVIPSSNPGKTTSQQYGQSGDLIVPGDYDGDGKTDYAVWQPSSGTWSVLLSSTGKTITQVWGENGDIPVPGDYDGDGKTDYAIWRPSNGTWYVIPSSNPSIYYYLALGVSGDIPVTGDYDGDGITDYGIWHPATGIWTLLLSSNQSQFVTQQWGLSTDIPAPGDYDGDGKTDYTVWRPSNGTFYSISSVNPKNTLIQQLGTNGDIPVPRDYDGDEKTDYAVWRPSTATWYVIDSSAPGAPIQTVWGTSTDVPVQKSVGQ